MKAFKRTQVLLGDCKKRYPKKQAEHQYRRVLVGADSEPACEDKGKRLSQMKLTRTILFRKLSAPRAFAQFVFFPCQ